MKIVSRLIFGVVDWASRNGLRGERASAAPPEAHRTVHRNIHRSTGVRGETYAYWYLRRHGYTIIARNYRVPGRKGEIDLVGYDSGVLAFVEVKTRTGESGKGPLGSPEDAVNADKRRNLSRMAREFLAERRIREAACRFDVVAIESTPGQRPQVRLHKGAFTA